MKLATFTHEGRTRIGAVLGDEILDLADAVPDLPRDLIGFLAAGPAALGAAEAAHDSRARRIPLAEVHLEAPVRRPGKLLAIALNYAKHIAEFGARERPKFPTFFNKQTTAVNGPYDPVHLPRVSDQLDFEGELGVVIGRRCRHVPVERAVEVVAGYVVVNDLSVRDWQAKAPTVTLGKSFDTHAPFGPWLVTADEIPDPQALRIRTTIDGEKMQDARTDGMIFSIAEQIATLSTAMTLEPGDLISTGTPEGVGKGRTPPRWLRVGERVRVEIDGIGAIENEVVPEPESTAAL